jgi:hypothetical protein
MVFTGTIDNFDGMTMRRRSDTEMYEVQSFTTVGEFPHAKLGDQMAVCFGESLRKEFEFLNAPENVGKRLRITVEVIE